ncbi:hypothetical protein BN1708_007923 [Verticillium longisporum]|uniref:Uncharacterized protein n=2 Tax=Verticillium longisporum TaxID=100787 RepID=A0A0G4MXN9_VERLO|nr:hypothetical protein BN1708_007923 [Verticillium longisporum]
MPRAPHGTDNHGRVAIITGGASGMGLAAGQEAASTIPNTVFLQTDVSSWASLSKAFDDTFERFGTIHFVFANAGIVEHANFYAVHDTTKSRMPPEPDQRVVDINLKSVINTTYLDQHYFRLSPHGGSDGVLVMTGSTGSLYPAEFCAMYAAAKAGVLNLMRSVAVSFYQVDGIRTYTICPGTVRTNLLSAERWGAFPAAYFTAVETVAARVCMLVTGGAMTDSSGRTIPAGEDYGLACEIAGDEFYWRDPVSYCNEATAKMMEATSMQLAEKHLEHDLKPQDRDALKSAAAKVSFHATVGSLVGLGLGVFMAYRLRRARADMFTAFRAAEKPTHVQFADGRTEPIPNIAPFLKPSTAGDIATYGLLGLGSLFLGGETGFLTGSWSATRAISRDAESRQRIETAFRRFRADVLRKQADQLDGGSKITDFLSF